MGDQQVERWLLELGLAHLIQLFRLQRIDVDALASLEDNHYVELGIVAVGDRAKLKRKVLEFSAVQNLGLQGGIGGSYAFRGNQMSMGGDVGTLQNNASNWNISQIHGMYQNMGFSAGAGMGLQNFPLQNSDQFQGAQIPSPQVMRNIEAQNLIQAQNLSNNVDPGEHQHQQNSNGGGVSTNNVRVSRTYTCSFCLEQLNSKVALKEHQQTLHPETASRPKSSKCEYCERYFPTKEKCEEHEAKVHADKPAPFKCAYCMRGFAWSITRVKHELSCPSRGDAFAAVGDGGVDDGAMQVSRDKNEQDDYKERLKARWEERYDELKEYKVRYGTCAVPQGWPENKGLASWVSSQRHARKKGALEDDKLKLLEEIEFVWKPRRRKEDQVDGPQPSALALEAAEAQRAINKHRRWHVIFLQLKTFKEAHGHCNAEGDTLLLAWAGHQRWLKANGKMSADKVRLLSEQGFDWNIEDDSVAQRDWDKMMGKLQQFHMLHGHANVPHTYPQDHALGRWVYFQRMCKAEIFDSVLTPERTKALEAIGFVWENREEKAVKKTWNERFQELLDYKAKHGHCDVPGAWWENPQLAQWVEKMRWIGGSGGLKEEQVVKLDEIGFQWESLARKLAWDSFLEDLCEYKDRNGHMNVSFKEDRRLNRWMKSQRDAKAEGKIKEERSRRLEEIGFDWNPPVEEGGATGDTWEARLSQLQARGEGGVEKLRGALRCWVHVQHELIKAGRLKDARKAKLIDAGFPWEQQPSVCVGDGGEEEWERYFQSWIECREVHGDCEPGQPAIRNYQGLEEWVWLQRMYKQEGLIEKLSPEKRNRLTETGFAWSLVDRKRTGSVMSWDERYQALAEYYAANGNSNVPPDCKTAALVGFVAHNRVQRSLGALNDEQVRLLDEVEFDWEGPMRRQWEDKIAELEAFKRQFGHVMTASVPEGKKLTGWIKGLRQQDRMGKLREDKKKQLMDTGVVFGVVDGNGGNKRGMPDDGFDYGFDMSPRPKKKKRKVNRPIKSCVFDPLPGDEGRRVEGDVTESEDEDMDD